MNWKKTLLAILGSAWFFPVSCTSSLAVGSHIIARMDSREVARGDKVHDMFSVALEPGDANKSFKLVWLKELSKQKNSRSYLLSKPTDEIVENEVASISYRVLEDHGTEQVIEVEEADDDYTVWSRYRATKSEITPISSRMHYVGYMFGAFPYAFAVALALYFLGLYLQWRNDQISIAQGAS